MKSKNQKSIPFHTGFPLSIKPPGRIRTATQTLLVKTKKSLKFKKSLCHTSWNLQSSRNVSMELALPLFALYSRIEHESKLGKSHQTSGIHAMSLLPEPSWPIFLSCGVKLNELSKLPVRKSLRIPTK